MHEISCAQNCFKYTSMQVKEQTCMLLKITWYGSRNCAKLVLKPLAAKNSLSIVHCCAVLCISLFIFSLFSFSVYMMTILYFCSLYTTQSIYIAVLPFLINWKQWSKSNILTMGHHLVLENSSSTAVYTMPNTIIFMKAIKYLNIRLRQIN